MIALIIAIVLTCIEFIMIIVFIKDVFGPDDVERSKTIRNKALYASIPKSGALSINKQDIPGCMMIVNDGKLSLEDK